jgi:diguanylate cyclase (GGDEF)-like protein
MPLPSTAENVIATADACLRRYSDALRFDQESDACVSAAWRLYRAVNELSPLARALLAENRELKQQLDTARRDPVTALPTRAAWAQAASALLHLADCPAVVMVDLDDFKEANDRHGHQAGDAILAAIGARLAAWAGPDAAVGRIGGDEFVAAYDAASPQAARRLSDLKTRLEQPVMHGGLTLTVGASVGQADAAQLSAASLSSLMHAADLAMYQDKGRGRRGRRVATAPGVAA